MSTEDNKTLVRRFIEEGWNQKNLALFDELAASNFTHHDSDFPSVRTIQDYKQWFTDNRNAFPDFQLTIDALIAEGDQVVTRWTFRGTNTGDIVTPMHIPATGKRVTVSGVTISRIAGGKFVENWQHGDTMAFMQQLGVMPAPGQ
jgi:steroid delta-isomerase-like uncharacterized protein